MLNNNNRLNYSEDSHNQKKLQNHNILLQL
jgi:hypothetical protein